MLSAAAWQHQPLRNPSSSPNTSAAPHAPCQPPSTAGAGAMTRVQGPPPQEKEDTAPDPELTMHL